MHYTLSCACATYKLFKAWRVNIHDHSISWQLFDSTSRVQHAHTHANIFSLLKFGCAPLPRANVCKDVDGRFSCPEGYACAAGENVTTVCKSTSLLGAVPKPAIQNVNARAVNMLSGRKNATRGNGGFCNYIYDELPSFCVCDDKQEGGTDVSSCLFLSFSHISAMYFDAPKLYPGKLECDVSFLGLDTIGVLADIEPCANPGTSPLTLTRRVRGVWWSKNIDMFEMPFFSRCDLFIPI